LGHGSQVRARKLVLLAEPVDPFTIMRRAVSVSVCAVLILGAACSPTRKTAHKDSTPRGGILRVVDSYEFSPLNQKNAEGLDPHTNYIADAWELFRCCLLRTLLSHSGQATRDGGAQLRPDLAARMPEVSADGLSWTFTLKRGIHYAPPLQSTEITAPDFVRAFQREAKTGMDSYGHYFEVIRGFEDYATGKSDSISGLSTPDPYTLVFRLTGPAGDFGNRVVLAATAPIPASPSNPSAPFGVAAGHDHEYGGFLVSSGPYMLEGSESLAFSLPAKQQTPAAGYKPGNLISLVRNPSWSAQSDDLRKAYVDRIEVRTVPDVEASRRLTLDGSADAIIGLITRDDALVGAAAKVRADPKLGSVLVGSGDFTYYAALNVATPPFDDVAVRRAVNYASDRTRLQEAWGGPYYGGIATHITPNSLENDLLIAYDPYAGGTGQSRLDLAKQEMAKSKYDKNHDGLCDAKACSDLVAGFGDSEPYPAVAREFKRELAFIGIQLKLVQKHGGALYQELADPHAHTPILLTLNWGKDFMNASNYLGSLFDPSQGSDYSLVGASPAELREWGYAIHSVPSVTSRVNQCQGLAGDSQIQCWASLDQSLMEAVVPWIPYMVTQRVILLSSRVVAASFDQFTTEPALDRIALRPSSPAGSSP
jgi:peptide/nickel transport system substrate-binding protein